MQLGEIVLMSVYAEAHSHCSQSAIAVVFEASFCENVSISEGKVYRDG